MNDIQGLNMLLSLSLYKGFKYYNQPVPLYLDLTLGLGLDPTAGGGGAVN